MDHCVVVNDSQESVLDLAKRDLFCLSVHQIRYCGRIVAKEMEVAKVLQLITQP